MKTVFLSIWLGLQAGTDFRTKEIPVWSCILASLVGIGFCVVERREIGSIILSVLPGIISIFFSRVTKEVIGYGDGIVLIAMGFFLSTKRLLSILMMALFIAGIVALILLVIFHKKGNYRMPFIPFLFIAYLLECSIYVEEFGI